MNKSFKTLAAAMLLGSTAIAPLAIAQDAGTGATTTPPAATGGAATPTPVPATPDATPGAMGTTAQAPAASSASGTYLTEQAENHISVNDFMGQAIYTSDNQSIGEINDLLVEDNGGVVAAVVGVGGFLGIGEKNVAIPFDKITITREMDENAAGTTGTGTTATTDTTATEAERVADAEVRLTTTETAESLRNAPEFRTLDDQAADADTTGMTPTDGTTTSSTDND
ncbi:MAG: PRC-barrel domain-containing protein [Rhizobium sp.]|nr:PRC-barrel domain-containing protein [Rhizobium sp.]